MYISMKKQLNIYSSAIAPALPYYLPSMAVSAIAPRQLLLRCPTTVHPWTYALSYYRPSMDICIVLVRPPWMVEVQILQEQISVCPSIHGSINNSACFYIMAAYSVSFFSAASAVCLSSASFFLMMSGIGLITPCCIQFCVCAS